MNDLTEQGRSNIEHEVSDLVDYGRVLWAGQIRPRLGSVRLCDDPRRFQLNGPRFTIREGGLDNRVTAGLEF